MTSFEPEKDCQIEIRSFFLALPLYSAMPDISPPWRPAVLATRGRRIFSTAAFSFVREINKDQR
jgi:hypothetical protein